jgi:Tfp pilus assembly protein PilN
MTQVNLLPPAVRQRHRTRQLTLAVIAAGGAAIALMLFVFVLQSSRLAKASDELAAQKAENNVLTTQISSLQRFQDLRQTVVAREALINSLTQGQVLWSGVLRDVSIVIPGDVWLDSMSGTLTGSLAPVVPGTVAPTTGSPVLGTIQFTGFGFTHPSIALWLTRLEQVTGWVNPWISSSQKQKIGDTPVVQFSGSVDLTPEATSSSSNGRSA